MASTVPEPKAKSVATTRVAKAKAAKPLTLAAPVRRRSRLAPEDRAEQILDVAARLLMADGFTEVTMERLGREAQISKALVYNYFPSRNDLLRALMERELKRSRVEQLQAVKASAGDFHELLRSTTKLAIVNMQQNGALLNKLWAEPVVVRAIAESEHTARSEAMAYFARKANKHYGLPMDLATAIVDMHMAMTGAAARHYADGRVDADAVTEVCLTIIYGSFEALQRRYGKPNGLAPATALKPDRPATRKRRGAAEALV